LALPRARHMRESITS